MGKVQKKVSKIKKNQLDFITAAHYNYAECEQQLMEADPSYFDEKLKLGKEQGHSLYIELAARIYYKRAQYMKSIILLFILIRKGHLPYIIDVAKAYDYMGWFAHAELCYMVAINESINVAMWELGQLYKRHNHPDAIKYLLAGMRLIKGEKTLIELQDKKEPLDIEKFINFLLVGKEKLIK